MGVTVEQSRLSVQKSMHRVPYLRTNVAMHETEYSHINSYIYARICIYVFTHLYVSIFMIDHIYQTCGITHYLESTIAEVKTGRQADAPSWRAQPTTSPETPCYHPCAQGKRPLPCSHYPKVSLTHIFRAYWHIRI